MSKPLYIVWNSNNKLGIPIIDEQHRGIVATINSLHYFIQEGHGLAVLKSTLDILEQYTHIHFQTEEALMKKIKYPDVEAHVLLHRALMKKTKEISGKSIAHKDPGMALIFLKKWWLNHINQEDRKYVSLKNDTHPIR